MQSKKTNRVLLIALIITVCAIFTVGTMVFAKYYEENISSGAIKASKMYFVCTDSNGNVYENGGVYYVLGDASLEFCISNGEDKFYTEKDISYSATISAAGESTESISGELEGGVLSKQVLVDKEFATGKTYTITVAVASPYSKTISFTVVAIEPTLASYYNVTDKGSYVELDIYIGNENKNITIKYGILSPDNSIVNISEWEKGDDSSHSEVLSCSAFTHYNLIFVKNGVDITVDNKQNQVISTDTIDITG